MEKKQGISLQKNHHITKDDSMRGREEQKNYEGDRK